MRSNQFTNPSSSGFTLIELVMVIVILGILSAVAFPKFADLSPEAEQARFDSIRAGFITGINLVHVKSKIHQGSGGFPDVSIGGQCIIVDPTSGYPAVNQSGSCTPVAFIPHPVKPDFESPFSFTGLIAALDISGTLISSAHAAPPPPPPPAINSELPAKLIDYDFSGWLWNQSGSTATLQSPKGLSFSYSQTTGVVN